MSKVLVITTSLRQNSNSDILASRLIAGAKKVGHKVERISLKGKKIGFCTGCLSCRETKRCVIRDDIIGISRQVKRADTLVFVTPIYFYNMSGQMKTLLDRLHPLYRDDYNFRNVYILSVAENDGDFVPEIAINGVEAWIDCFYKSELRGSLFCNEFLKPGEAADEKDDLEAAYKLGKEII